MLRMGVSAYRKRISLLTGKVLKTNWEEMLLRKRTLDKATVPPDQTDVIALEAKKQVRSIRSSGCISPRSKV